LWQTEGHTTTAYAALAWRRAVNVSRYFNRAFLTEIATATDIGVGEAYILCRTTASRGKIRPKHDEEKVSSVEIMTPRYGERRIRSRGATTFSKLGVQFLSLGYCTEQNTDGISFVHRSLLRNGNHTLHQKSLGGPSNFFGGGGGFGPP